MAQLSTLGIVHTMSNLPPDTRAHRLEIYASLVAFVVGFFGMLALWGWLIVRFVMPEVRWWDVVHTSVSAIMISFVFGGMGLAALTMWILSRYHYKRGVYRCNFCGRPLRGIGITCECRAAER